MQELRHELTEYYQAIREDVLEDNAEYIARYKSIRRAMDRYASRHPKCHPCLLKARLYEEIAKRCRPVVFPHSPFYWEIGVRPAENWGTPHPRSAASWMIRRRQHLAHETDAFQKIRHFGRAGEDSVVRLWNVWSAFDVDHHCLGYTTLLEVGVGGVLDAIAARRHYGGTEEQLTFLTAAERGCQAVLQIAARFAEEARRVLSFTAEPRAREFLQQIADTAPRIPAEPPKTFYEALAMLWFCREITASLESIGVSVVGHVDRMLVDFYEDDLAAGRLTEDQAGDLLARWMLPTDVKFHVHDNAWPETSTCMELGGCDAEGHAVHNELTRLVLDVHRRHALFNPKPNCRISATAPAAYLERISESILAGHNHFALPNDDVLIPACVRSGKTLAQARAYVNGGCQETICEGVEHSAGAYFYFNMARVLDLCLQPLTFDKGAPRLPRAEQHLPAAIDHADDFETFYDHVLAALGETVSCGARWLAEAGRRWEWILPCPWFSTTLAGCLDNAADYTTGAALYNTSAIALVGFATVVDSLQAVRQAVFEERLVTLAELRAALAENWAGHDALRARLISLPKFGHADPGADQLAARLARDVAGLARGLRNERGGHFQPSFFVYYAFQWMGQDTRATPDGRGAGDYLSQGVSPSRLRPPRSLTDVFRSLGEIDFADFPGNCVLDVQLPLGRGMTPQKLAAAIRAFARLGGPTLQLNCVSVDELKDARVRPEDHQDLVVRIAGLSARFVALTPEVQAEIIDRAVIG